MLGRLLGRGGPDRAQVLAEHLGLFFAPAEVTGIGSNPGEWDFLEVAPTPQRPWRAVCTVGTGSNVEFLIGMPADMPVTDEIGFPGWPVQVLLDLAAHSHQRDVGPGHTMARADPPEPLAPGVPFVGALAYHPVRVDPEACVVRVGRRDVHLLAVFPLHPAELALARDGDLDELLDHLEAAGVDELLDPARPSAVA